MKIDQIIFSPTGWTQRVSEILCLGMDKADVEICL